MNQNLTKTKKQTNKKCAYVLEKYKNLLESENQKLAEYRIRYYEIKKKTNLS